MVSEDEKCLKGSHSLLRRGAGRGAMVTNCDAPYYSKWGMTNRSPIALLLGEMVHLLDLNGKCPVSKQACSVTKYNCFIEHPLCPSTT